MRPAGGGAAAAPVFAYPNRFRVWISGQVSRVTKTIRREMRRRAAVEPVIGHVKAEHHMARDPAP
jgi:transposase, IS5 family